jgi:hypothetical protein
MITFEGLLIQGGFQFTSEAPPPPPPPPPFAGDTWTYTGSLVTEMANSRTFSVTSNDTTLVAGAVGGKIATSTDGINWTFRNGLSTTTWGSDFGAYVNAIVWNGSIFLAVGVGGRAATSTDGINWTYRAGLNTAWGNIEAKSISWNGTQFIIGGNNGRIATSPDGISFTDRDALRTNIGWGNGNGTSAVLSLVWNGSIYLATGEAGRAAISSNGIDWTIYTNAASAAVGGSYSIYAAWNGTVFALVSVFKGATTTDGITYTAQNSLGSRVWSAVSWSGTNFCAGALDGYIATSTDGATWTEQTALRGTGWGTTNDVYSITWDNRLQKFVAVGDIGACAISPAV